MNKLDQEIQYKCPWCDVVKNLRGLACHAGRIHKQPASELHKLVLHGGVVPLCACGCGQSVKWLQKYYGEYLRGHNGFSDNARAAASGYRRKKSQPVSTLSTKKVTTKFYVTHHKESKKNDSNHSKLEQVTYEDNATSSLFQCGVCKVKIRRTHQVTKISPNCPACLGHQTKAIDEIFAFVKTICSDAVQINPIQIQIPSKKIAIQYNDLYWHSEKHKSRNYHHNASTESALKGIALFHIFSDDWRTKKQIILSMIQHRLGASTNQVYARSCKIVQVDAIKRKEFFTRCHLDGDTASMAAFGLEVNNRLVAVVSLRRPFHKKWNDCSEIARYATELNVSVIGGLSRLITVAKSWAKNKGYSRLMSYVDGRIGYGAGYLLAGFTIFGTTSPSFWWTDYYERYNRFKYRADKKRNMSERAVAEEACVVRIYGCANSIMLMDI